MSKPDRYGDNPWATGNQPPAAETKNKKPKKPQRGATTMKPSATTVNPKSSAERAAPAAVPSQFVAAQQKHLGAAKLVTTGYESSSDEEDLATDELLASVLTGYGGDQSALVRTQHCLETMFQSGAATCLICIASIRRVDHIWSCRNCFNFFHLGCIERWANDSTSQKRAQQNTEVGYYTNQGVYVPKVWKAIEWDCPKCRHEYEFTEIPHDYNCFCGKERNPPNQPWLVPHSCGEQCQKRLKPDCGHRCVLLCHPGPCPPCPQMISTSCRCGQSNRRMIRCSQQSWTCLNKCGLTLSCGSHVCGQPCHAAAKCPPCPKKSQQRCVCGTALAERNCDAREWQCDKACGKPYSCERHQCEQRCHIGDCGDCPRGMPRSCPCGKEKSQAPCSQEVLPCGNTCQKPLHCGAHICAERCHVGPCGQCLRITKKVCRCGLHEKELPCHKAYLCETKCKQMRYCTKHACNRKCCDKDCPPCDKVCGKTLSCNKHKCSALCHLGQCYPCPQRSIVKCRCGQTSVEVACGREKQTRPPKCSQPCRLASKCHHSTPHRCHPGECPTCCQPCAQSNDTTHCQHACMERCHDAVRIALVDRNFKPAGPWEKAPEKFVVQKLPHPPCEFSVAVTCIGGHETVDLPCHSSKSLSCGRLCGRRLQCGNHTCLLECHTVSDPASQKQDADCAPCQSECLSPRPDGCVHSCEKACHLGPCAKCRINIKLSCHCGLTPVYSKCGDFYNGGSDAAQAERDRLMSCGQRCSRNYPCGHRCTGTCHAGDCPNPESCTKKVKIVCRCKTRRTEIGCDKAKQGCTLDCDEVCAMKLENGRLAAEEAERVQRAAEEERNRIELLEFERKMGKKKSKERKRVVVEEKRTLGWIVYVGVAVGLVAVLAAVATSLDLV